MRIALPDAARAGFAALSVAAVAVACSSSSGAGTAGDQLLQVKVKDFAIKAPKQLAAGTIVLHVRNGGPDTHELIIVRADGRTLPLRKDNLTVDESAVKSRVVGTLEDDHPGTRRIWQLHLPPGSYVLFCNMYGHYLGGMHTRLVVR